MNVFVQHREGDYASTKMELGRFVQAIIQNSTELMEVSVKRLQ